MEFKFDKEKNKEKIEKFRKIIQTYKDTKGALIPVLQGAQEIFGYLPVEILQLISEELNIPISEIYGVTTFYSQFSFIPKGDNIISVCLGTACYVKEGQEILEEFENQLGIKSGDTTEDMKFSITSTRCVGDCSMAPVVIVNDDVYPRLKKDKVKEIILKYGGAAK